MGSDATVDPPAVEFIGDAVQTPTNMAGDGNQRGVSGHGKLVPGGGANPDLLLGGKATRGVRLGDCSSHTQGQQIVQGHRPSISHLEYCVGDFQPLDWGGSQLPQHLEFVMGGLGDEVRLP